jgi:hypothetical protein
MKKLTYFLCSLFFLSLLASCNSGTEQAQGEDELTEFMSEGEEEMEVPKEVLDDIVRNIPSPVEMSALLKAIGIPFKGEILNHTANADKYTTAHKQAINLGIYGADLGYINMYEKTGSSLNYLNAVKTVADQIKVGQFFDFATLKRLSNNKKDVDSLTNITILNFNKMDNYLREQGRGNLSILMVAGAWLEGLYISCQVAKEHGQGHDEIVEKIGEQKIVIDDVLLLLSVFGKDAGMKPYIEKFEGLKAKFDEITIVETYAEPETKEVDGKLVVTDNSSSVVKISPEQLEAIIAITDEVRNDFIN